MNKRELVDAISGRVGDKKTANEAVNAILETIQHEVAKGEKVAITGFGAFEKVHRPARTARNPASGEAIKVAESWAPKFRAGADFKAAVNTAPRKAAPKAAAKKK
ncbi:HU family DNA-binding protein [Rhizohabitans arisaemae]|uniref:HU family DNA-binding protein n=1 Tax=Rhizohabitans arisaemae TaxID=2720610 RepID=UPI0024B224D9|nr:HU family DNA-binding protein [Rhizohabitans arisaemae]